jgi:hypothetical protein
MACVTLSACDSDLVVMVASTRTLADVTLRVMSSGSTSENRAAMLILYAAWSNESTVPASTVATVTC